MVGLAWLDFCSALNGSDISHTVLLGDQPDSVHYCVVYCIGQEQEEKLKVVHMVATKS